MLWNSPSLETQLVDYKCLRFISFTNLDKCINSEVNHKELQQFEKRLGQIVKQT
jgi:hypothetical protein